MISPPRLFVSYSWSTPEHEQWVVELATALVESGVDVMIDKWDLKEGHDSIAFMEKMVTDESITKVIIVCDEAYASKADGRAGGVGTETQIISPEIYAKQSQDKFVAVLAERDSTGKPYLPTFYKSRIYIDLSELEKYSDNFEKLLRWIFDKPLHVRPERGKPPSFVVEIDSPLLGTSILARRVIDGFKGDKGFTRGAFDEYLSTFSENLERFRISGNDGEADDQIIKSIEDFVPSRNEFLSVLNTASQYGDIDTYAQRLHKFFESLIPYLSNPPTINTWKDIDFDNFKFIIHELFLYALALLLRAEKFGSANYLLSQPYYIFANASNGKDPITDFTVFRKHMNSLVARNKRLNTRRLSLRADLLEQRSKNALVQFNYLMQADFVCFLREEISNVNGYINWWPETLLYADRYYGPFEIFARSTSRLYLMRTLPLLGTLEIATLNAKLTEFSVDGRKLPRWEGNSFNPNRLLGFEQLGTKP